METLKGIFGTAKDSSTEATRPKAIERTPSGTKKWIKELSPLANSVVGRCARILLVRPEDLQKQFEQEAAASAKTPDKYAKNLLEYCSFRALSVSAQVAEHLNDKDFRRLSYDMMLAWEAPDATSNNPMSKVQQELEKVENKLEAEQEEDADHFFSDLMPIVAEVETAVRLEAFARIAPAIPVLADIITVHPQWEALTNTTGGLLPFPVYDKYLSELDKSIKSVKGQISPTFIKALNLEKHETVVEIDGGGSQAVLQHMGVSTWPGRLTLTDHAMYFEKSGVLSYGEAQKYDLASNLNQVVKPDLTGPWGARVFDKAVMFKSNADLEPTVLEFSEVTGNQRRDYWLAIIREIIAAHKFSRTYKLEGVGKSEALARAVLGITRMRAVKETFNKMPPRPDNLLTYTFGDEMPNGDMVMAALADTLRRSEHGQGGDTFLDLHEGNRVYASSATAAVASIESVTPTLNSDQKPDASVPIGEFVIGELTPLEKAILQSRENTKQAEVAQATIDGVKVEGIGTNIAVMTELLKPVNVLLAWCTSIIEWQDPFKTISTAVVITIFIYMNWIFYVPSLLLLTAAGYILYLRYMKKREQMGVGEILVPQPPSQSTVEQLLALQQALAQLEGFIQTGNIGLLKLRTLCLSNYPEASNQVVGLLVAGSIGLALLPSQWIALIIFVNLFTGQMQSRKESSAQFNRRISEWWRNIPVVPVRFLKPEEQESLGQQ